MHRIVLESRKGAGFRATVSRVLVLCLTLAFQAGAALADGVVISPELVDSLSADIRASTYAMAAERRVYSWLVADKLIGDEETYEATQKRLVQRSVLFANQFWTDEVTTYTGAAGSGTYAAPEPLHSMGFGYDAAKPGQWILMSIPLPVGTRLLDLRRFSRSARTQGLLKAMGCASGDYQWMISNRHCYAALRAGLEKMEISGIAYHWPQARVLCSSEQVAFVLFNPTIFELPGVRHFRMAHQDQYEIAGALSDELKDEMAMLDLVTRPRGVALWPKIAPGTLAKRLKAGETVESVVKRTVLGCSSAWSSGQLLPGWLLEQEGPAPAGPTLFELGDNRNTPVPLIPMSNLYKGISVVEATFGGNYRGPEDSKISALESVAAACQDKTECLYPVDYAALGNPFAGVDKVFRITYRCSKARVTDETKTAPGKTGGPHPLPLACGDDEGVIQVESAEVLPQFRVPARGNATAKARAFLGEKLKATYKVSAQYLGDPLPGAPKSFEMIYACPKDTTDLKRVFIAADAEGKTFDIACE
jgi:hypothetical protein